MSEKKEEGLSFKQIGIIICLIILGIITAAIISN